MASTDLDIQGDTQLAQDQQNEAMDVDSPSEEAIQHKSAVYVDPFAARGGNRFQKGDTVHMSTVENGVRRKGIFIVRHAKHNDKGGYWEYQLSDGAWVRENKLKLEKARQ